MTYSPPYCPFPLDGGRGNRLAKIKDLASATAIPADPTTELRTWLATLAKTVADRRPRAVLIGAKSWTAQADHAVAQLGAIAAEDGGCSTPAFPPRCCGMWRGPQTNLRS